MQLTSEFLFQSAEFDPCLDDCVMFAKKLRKVGNKVTLDVVKGLPHGFLNFCMVRELLIVIDEFVSVVSNADCSFF